MKTDELDISNSVQAASALDKIELIALYAGMSRKVAGRMRLVAEELLAATKSIADNYQSQLWMETDEKSFSLHLRIAKPMSRDERDKLIALSKTGKATARKGLIPRLISAIEDSLLDAADAEAAISRDFVMLPVTMTGSDCIYTYRYIPKLDPQQYAKAEQPVDELSGVEKAIIDSFVNDIFVTSQNGSVEITAVKLLN